MRTVEVIESAGVVGSFGCGRVRRREKPISNLDKGEDEVDKRVYNCREQSGPEVI